MRILVFFLFVFIGLPSSISFDRDNFFKQELQWECHFLLEHRDYFYLKVRQDQTKRHFEFFFNYGSKKIKIFDLIMANGFWYYKHKDQNSFARFLAYGVNLDYLSNAYYYLLASKPQFFYSSQVDTIGREAYSDEKFSYFQRGLKQEPKIKKQIAKIKEYLQTALSYRHRFQLEKDLSKLYLSLLTKQESILNNKSKIFEKLVLFDNFSLTIRSIEKLAGKITLPKKFIDRSNIFYKNTFFINSLNEKTHSVDAVALIDKQKSRLPFRGLDPILVDYRNDFLYAVVKNLPKFRPALVKLDKKTNEQSLLLNLSLNDKSIKFLGGKLSPNSKYLALLAYSIEKRSFVICLFDIKKKSFLFQSKKQLELSANDLFWKDDKTLIFTQGLSDDKKVFLLDIQTQEVTPYRKKSFLQIAYNWKTKAFYWRSLKDKKWRYQYETENKEKLLSNRIDIRKISFSEDKEKILLLPEAEEGVVQVIFKEKGEFKKKEPIAFSSFVKDVFFD